MGNVPSIQNRENVVIGLSAAVAMHPDNICIGSHAGPILSENDNVIIGYPCDPVMSEYKKCININKKLKIMCNIPQYIKMELMENQTTLSFYQLYNSVN